MLTFLAEYFLAVKRIIFFANAIDFISIAIRYSLQPNFHTGPKNLVITLNSITKEKFKCSNFL